MFGQVVSYCTFVLQAFSQVNGDLSYTTSQDQNSLSLYETKLTNSTINVTITGGVTHWALMALGAELYVIGSQINISSEASGSFSGLGWFSEQTNLLDSVVNVTQTAAARIASAIAKELSGVVQIVATVIAADLQPAGKAAVLALQKSADLNVSLVGSKISGKVNEFGSPLVIGVIGTYKMTNSRYCVAGASVDEQGQNCWPLCHAGFVLNLAKTDCVISGACGPNTKEIQPPQCACQLGFPYDKDYDLCMPPPKTISKNSFPAVVIVNVQKTQFMQLNVSAGQTQCVNGVSYGEVLFKNVVLIVTEVQDVGGALWGVVRHFSFTGCVKMQDVWNGQYSSLRMLAYNAKTYANSSAPQYSDMKKTQTLQTIPVNTRIFVDSVFFDSATGRLYGSTTYGGKSGVVNMVSTNTSTLLPLSMSLPFVHLTGSTLKEADLTTTIRGTDMYDVMIGSAISCSGLNCDFFWAQVSYQDITSSPPTSSTLIYGNSLMTSYKWNGNYFAPDNLPWISFKVVVIVQIPRTSTMLRAIPSTSGVQQSIKAKWTTFTINGIYRCVDAVTDGSLWGFVSNAEGYVNMADVQYVL